MPEEILVSYEQHAVLWEQSNSNQHQYCARHHLNYARFVGERSKLLSRQKESAQVQPKNTDLAHQN